MGSEQSCGCAETGPGRSGTKVPGRPFRSSLKMGSVRVLIQRRIRGVALLGILLGLGKDLLSLLGELGLQRGEAPLRPDEVQVIPGGFLGIQDKGILAFRLCLCVIKK